MSTISVTHKSGSRTPPKSRAGLNLETWMKDLPDFLRVSHISILVIPGSRHSTSFSIDNNSVLAGDYVKLQLNGLWKVFSPFLSKQILIRWSKVQNENFASQLKMGIRYFDMRLQFDETNEMIRSVHLMKSDMLSLGLTAINKFLRSHPKEVVILDFQHFIGFTPRGHMLFNQILRGTFGDKLCPGDVNVAKLTLDGMYKRGYQVIVVYRYFGTHDHFKSSFFPIVYSKTANPTVLKESAIERLSIPWPSRWLLIVHMILKPEKSLGFWGLFKGAHSLAKTALSRSTREFVGYLKGVTARPSVIVAHFVDIHQAEFSRLIVALNYSEPSSAKIPSSASSTRTPLGSRAIRKSPKVKKQRNSSDEFMKRNSSWWLGR